MLKTIITAIITYLATSIDEIPVLFMLYTKTSNKGRGKTITFYYFVGTFILISLGLLGAFGLCRIPDQWMIGLVGLVPLVMGIKILLKGEGDEVEEAVESAQRHKSLGIQVLAITIGLGADDLGVYIPLFTTLTGWEVLQMLFVFVLGTAILCFASYRLTRIDQLTAFIETYERFIIGIIFEAIGVFVMAECGTLTYLYKYVIH